MEVLYLTEEVADEQTFIKNTFELRTLSKDIFQLLTEVIFLPPTFIESKYVSTDVQIVS